MLGCPHSFPRIRGDVPVGRVDTGLEFLFSPHTRGCSFGSKSTHQAGFVFPAYAGMFRLVTSKAKPIISFPRIRGDVPTDKQIQFAWDMFSPHTRGCSASDDRPKPKPPVFPAYAGMFRFGISLTGEKFGFPRIRGDVPRCCTQKP